MSDDQGIRYTVAIRTLGLNPELLRRELESVYRQTIAPERVVIYIAQGYAAPDFRVGEEAYVSTPKGMVAQRAVDYSTLASPLLLLLDDDVVLADDSVEVLARALSEHGLDCIAPDTFHNHQMPLTAKVYAALSNLTLPHRGQDVAFAVRRHGSFAYIADPRRDVYRSQSCAGPCALWRREALIATDFQAELWLDGERFGGFSYNDDTLEFYKLHRNGGRLGVHFNAGVDHVGGKTSSSRFHSNPKKFYYRAQAQYAVWHRSMIACNPSAMDKALTHWWYWLKFLATLPAIFVAAAKFGNAKIPYYHVAGTIEGVRYTRSAEYKSLRPYVR